MTSRRTDLWLAVPVGAGAVLAAASLVDGPALLAQIQALSPVVALVGLVFVVLALLRRRLLVAAVALVATSVLYAPVASLPVGSTPPGTETLSVLAVNTYGGSADAATIVAEVDARDADVLVMPEMTESMWRRLQDAGLRTRLPHATGRPGGGAGMIVATREPVTCPELPDGVTCGRIARAPLTDTGVDEQGRPVFDQIVVALPDGTHVKGVHLWSPRTHPLSRWQENQHEMAQWIADQPADRSLVLAGDFNAGRSHPAFRRYEAGFDRTPRGGFPWTRTWPNEWPVPPFVQIDHVLARGWRAQRSKTLVVPGSDHLGVWTLLTR